MSAIEFGLVSVTLLVLGEPIVTLPNASDLVENVGARSVPVPFSAIVAGLFLALLAICRVPVRVPCAVGAKITPIVQFVLESGSVPAGCRMVPLRQGFTPTPVVVVLKSPVGVTLSTVIATELGLDSVAILTVALESPTTVLVNKMLVETPINPARPVPLSAIDCGLLEELELNDSVPVRVPRAAAVKSTLTEQVPVGGSVAPVQVSLAGIFANSGEGLATTLEMVSAPAVTLGFVTQVPGVPAVNSPLQTVTVLGEVVVPEFRKIE